ncbi:glycosyltransferase family 4 protein [Halomonas sp. E14]|uniref:glycosyltransferase family 4 protein n=1 Tax=Halomonas sp. E14 TaxID=3397245 RepID=UPI00403ECEC7
MRIVIVGLRGIPDVQGGVERHVEKLAPRLVELGCDVHVIGRRAYQPVDVFPAWKGVILHAVWTPKNRYLEAPLHTFLSVLYSVILRPHVIHFHAIGPSLFVPFARLLGFRVVVTHHGPDYERAKWGGMAKNILRLGEYAGMRYSNARISISETISNLVMKKYKKNCFLIPNGVEAPAFRKDSGVLEEFGLVPKKYVLMVSRFVPEKNHHDLIKAFDKLKLAGWKLVFVGRADHQDSYSSRLLSEKASNHDIIFTGFKSGDNLANLYYHAGVFVLPSSHEGLPIALLEALSFGLPVVASNIPANLEVGLPEEQYFKLGDSEDLAEKIRLMANRSTDDDFREKISAEVIKRYDWDVIADKTVAVYESL